jgi:anti-sigma-K factor RskA
MKNASWRTTAAGICAIIVAVATAAGAMFDTDAATNPDWGSTVAAVLAGIGLLAARDNKVTSEQAGAGA